MKSNPYKSKKYRFDSKGKKQSKSLYKDFSPDWSTGPFSKNIFSGWKKSDSNSKGELFHEKEIYVNDSRIKNRPAWLVPVLVVLLISFVVFWAGPLVLNAITKALFQRAETDTGANLRYASTEYVVVRTQVADLFENPDLKAARKTQVLYNQMLHILDRSTYGYLQVELDDGTKGYVMSDDVTSYTSCIEPSLYKFKIIVIAKSKRIMTHSSNGSTVMEALMGTVLYSNYQGDGVYKVALPDQSEGWISASGILKIKSDEEIQKSSAKSFYTTVLSFNDTTYINQGMTQNGASSEGIAYIAAKVNGIDIPRAKQEQSKAGQEVPVAIDEETSLPKFDNFQEGDLVFFQSSNNPGTVGEMGIVVGYGQVLMSRNSKASVKMINLAENTELARSILVVRRIF